MQQFRNLLSSLSLRQRITIVVVAAMVCGALFAFSRWQREQDFKPLFSGLSSEDASAIVRRLKESATEFRISDNGTTVLVPSGRVAEARLELAGAGLPKSGRIGFELFDRTNFGMTDFTEHVNLRRAVEGELERSVMAMGEVEAARVHVSFQKDSVFLESRQPAKASVLLKLRPGARLSQQNVMAINHLVASAVEGLSPDGVSVLDMKGNLLGRPKRVAAQDATALSDDQLEYEQKLEKALLAKINTTLEPVFGSEKFRAVVSAECDFTSGELSEETFDPSSSVMLTSQKTEDVLGGSTSGGIPGTASTLPKPTPRSGGGTSSGRVTENITYQTSRKVRHSKLPQALIKKLSVSVLLDQGVRWEGKQKVLVPPSPESVKVVKDLVTAAVGLNAGRGDQMIVESLPFESSVNMEFPEAANPATSVRTPKAVGWQEQLKQNPNGLWMLGAAIFVVLLLAAGAFRHFRRVAVPAVRAGVRPAIAASKSDKLPAAIPADGAAPQSSAAVGAGEFQRMLNPSEKSVDLLLVQARDMAKKDVNRSVVALRDWVEERG
jgi:flagellar M-ring protein FliF